MAKNQKLVNIPRDIDDEFHRYKMPVLQAKVEGRGNGIKTVIVNMSQIAESLERPPSYPTKFFGFELGALTKCDEEADRYVVNGKHDGEALAKLLDDFIDKFILCKQCDRNPETVMLLKGGKIELKCKACGGRTPVDMIHKLSTYILKNPPPEQQASGKSAKSQKREDDARQLTNYSNKDFLELKDDKKVEWSQDTSEAAVIQRRKAQLGEKASALLVAENNPVEEVSALLLKDPGLSDKELVTQVQQIATRENWSERKALQTVFACLFDGDILKQIKSRSEILNLFSNTELHQKIILLCVEKLCDAEKGVIDRIADVLLGFWEAGVLDEEILIKWHSHPNKRLLNPKVSKQIREKATPFIKWLQEAEDEDGPDD